MEAILGERPDGELVDVVPNAPRGSRCSSRSCSGPSAMAGLTTTSCPVAAGRAACCVERLSPRAARVRVSSAAARWVPSASSSPSPTCQTRALHRAARGRRAAVAAVDPVGRGYGFRHALARAAIHDDLLPGERTACTRLTPRPWRTPTWPGLDAPSMLAHHWLAAHDLPRRCRPQCGPARPPRQPGAVRGPTPLRAGPGAVAAGPRRRRAGGHRPPRCSTWPPHAAYGPARWTARWRWSTRRWPRSATTAPPSPALCSWAGGRSFLDAPRPREDEGLEALGAGGRFAPGRSAEPRESFRCARGLSPEPCLSGSIRLSVPGPLCSTGAGGGSAPSAPRRRRSSERRSSPEARWSTTARSSRGWRCSSARRASAPAPRGCYGASRIRS